MKHDHRIFFTEGKEYKIATLDDIKVVYPNDDPTEEDELFVLINDESNLHWITKKWAKYFKPVKKKKEDKEDKVEISGHEGEPLPENIRKIFLKRKEDI